jgi:mannose PTS system EIIAB component
MPLVMSRIDDRLIHGQVTVGWIRSNQITLIVIVDDKVAVDPVSRAVVGITAPPGVKVLLQKVDEFAADYNTGKYEKPNTLLIFTKPEPIVRLVKQGIKISSINVGGMRYLEGKQKISKTISVDESDVASFRELLKLGIEIETRMVPSEPKAKLEPILPKE